AQCSYHVNVVRSRSLKGPYIKYEGNPVVDTFDGWKCTGHGTIVTTKKGEDYYLYHAYDKITDVHTGRQGMLAKLSWDKQTGWPSFYPVSGKEAAGFTDEFSGTALNTVWQWDFRNSQPVISVKNGHLYLSGQVKPANNTGTALTVRPFYANYEISTAVVNDNESLKGLAVYGDANQAIGMGVKGNLVEVWYVKDNSRKVLKLVKVNSTGSTHLKIVVSNGCDFRFFMGKGQDKWDEITVPGTDLKEVFLAPWDRSPRPGLLQQGHEPAIFDYFSISYF
ncbi:MAG: family 43 glycosylhydrolase, partial [Niabella sp.]